QTRTTALLLANNADPNIANTLGLTALHIAASKGHYQIVSSLLQSGANPNIESTDGVTPLRLAMLGNHDDVGQLLLQYRAKRETRFVSAMRDHLSNEGMDTTSLSVNQVRQQYARKMQQPSVPQGYHVPQQVTVHTPLPAPQISARPVTDPAQYARIQEAKKVFARLADINRYFPELSFEERAEINRKRLEYEQQYADVMPLLEAHERADIDSARFLWESWAQANKSRL
ncbi:MAG: ankyrin repeat domain-containing protein, partial [Rickettsiales bacterium]|nr:ankyrin repeat domain-containing protein [Rickettsiales bacterium]